MCSFDGWQVLHDVELKAAAVIAERGMRQSKAPSSVGMHSFVLEDSEAMCASEMLGCWTIPPPGNLPIL